MKKTKLVIGILLASLSGAAAQALDRVTLSGLALYSFSATHFLVQSERYVYKVKKSELSDVERVMIDQASEQNLMVRIAVNRRAIEFLWPVNPYERQEKAVSQSKLAKKILNEANSRAGKITLKGTTVLSFSDPFVLVQVNDKIYRVGKAALSAQTNKAINEQGLGARVALTVPLSSVDLVWSNEVSRGPASVEKSLDEVEVVATGLHLKGTVLSSFSEPETVIQAKGVFFQLKKKQISTNDRKKLEAPGSAIELTVPMAGVEFLWPVDPSEGGFKTVRIQP